MAKDLKTIMNKFLRYVGVDASNKDEALQKALHNSLLASVQRGGVYNPNLSISDRDRKELKKYWGEQLCDIAEQDYKNGVSDSKHCRNIEDISERVSKKYPRLLAGRRLRIGTAQKSLNLYLKHLWCLGEIKQPPHCTVDRVILEKVHRCNKIAKWKGRNFPKWTQCDDIDEYERWICEIEKVVKESGIDHPAEWELRKWNEWNEKRVISKANPSAVKNRRVRPLN